MGFTQKASCRPYKNCYKGGSRKKEILNIKMPTTRRSGRKSGRKSRKSAAVKPPAVSIFQQSYTYSSHPAPGRPYGHLVRVSYENGKGVRAEANLNKAGKPIKLKQTPVKR